jgi:hypothetical protein
VRLLKTVIVSLLLILPACSSAAQTKHKAITLINKSWLGHFTSSYGSILTINHSKSSFGIMCIYSKKSCFYFLSPPVKCSTGANVPIIEANRSGFNDLNISTTCLGKNLIFKSSSLLDALNDSRTVNFAMPLQNARFVVLPFTTLGFKKLEVILDSEVKSKTKSGTLI